MFQKLNARCQPPLEAVGCTPLFGLGLCPSDFSRRGASQSAPEWPAPVRGAPPSPFVSTLQSPPRLLPRLRLRFALRSVRAPSAPVLHPNLVEICLVSSLSFPTLPPSIGRQRLPPQLVRGDDKYTVWLGVWHIDDPQGPPSPCLPDGNPRTFPTVAVFTWTTEDLFDFFFGDVMVEDVRLASGRVSVEAN